MLQNLHTHTTLCDGKNSPEEIIGKAIELGFDSIGFSAHGKTVYDTDWELRCSYNEYVDKIKGLKPVYADKIDIFIGAELDYYSKNVMPTVSFDYTIGSVHATERCGKVVDFDFNPQAVKESIETLYGGSSLEYARSYYEKVVEMANEIDYDIVGHFDLITKFSETHPTLIDLESKAYKRLALEALAAVREKKEFFEVNTGAISRGYKALPYPAPFILDEMRKLDCKLILTSDCHQKEYLSAYFNEAKEYIKSHGFDSLYYLTRHGFKKEKI